MKRIFSLVILILFTITIIFFSCEEDQAKKQNNEQEPEQEPEQGTDIDRRLLGGKWYNIYWPYKDNPWPFDKNEENGFIAFSENKYDDVFFTSTLKNVPGHSTGIGVYSKGGIIYDRYNEIKIFNYEFVEKWPFVMPYPQNLYISYLDWLSENGDIIVYRFYNIDTIYDDGRPEYEWILMRFSE